MEPRAQQRWQTKVWLPLSLLCLLLMACGHSPELRHPLYGNLMPAVRKVLLLQPEVSIIEELADGSRLWQERESQAAGVHIRQAVVQRLSEQRLAIQVADPAVVAMLDAQAVQALFRAVNKSIHLHVYGPQPIPNKLKSFDYQLGPIETLLAASGADALVLAIAYQFESPNRPKTWLAIALVEPGGRIVWYNTQAASADIELSSLTGAHTLVRLTLAQFGDSS